MNMKNEETNSNVEYLQETYDNFNNKIMRFYEKNLAKICEICSKRREDSIQIIGLRMPWTSEISKRVTITLTLYVNNKVHYSIAIWDNKEPYNINDDYIVIDSNQYHENMRDYLEELAAIVLVLQHNSLELIIKNATGV